MANKKDVSTIAVIGAGIMGRGIAHVAALGGFTSRTWTVRELVLVRSSLPRSGVPGEQPRYEAVARWALGGAG